MAFDEHTLSSRYDLTTLRVLSSSQISARTAAIIARLALPGDDAAAAPEKRPIVALTADAKVSSKLISIVEIAKRELATNGIKCCQYNVLSSNMIEIERRPKPKLGVGIDAGIEESGGEEDAFQTMGAHLESATKTRNVPVLTVYLSTASVRELKNAFGEQT